MTKGVALHRTVSPAMPEDFTAQSDQLLMDLDGTRADGARMEVIRDTAKVGQLEGFSVLVTVPDDAAAAALHRATKGLDNVETVVAENYAWPEDSLHFRTDGTAVTAPDRRDPDGDLHRLVNARYQRLTGQPSYDAYDAMESRPEIKFNFSGIISEGGARSSADFIQAAGGRVKTARSFVEGGNVITGTRDGRPYALVGKDALERNRGILGTDENGVRETMAADLGVAPNDLHFVEQPHDFHIDMSMAPWGHNRVLLNDAPAAAEVQIRAQGLFPNDPKATALRADAQRRAPLEDLAARDLEAAGFEVVRIPGRFFEVGEERPAEIANFLNGEAGQNKQGAPYFITQNGPPSLKEAFLSELPADLDVNVHFVASPASARKMLSLKGGANCMIKRLPNGWNDKRP